MSFQKIYSWFQQKGRVIYLIYGALALIVLLPLFRSGYVFAMDMVFVPHLSWPESFNVPGAFLYFLNFILPSQVIQKIFLFLVLFLAGIGMHRLIPFESSLPKYFAGIFYIFNPWVYSRFLFGHLWLLMAYALMPFVVKTIFIFFNKPNLKNSLKLSLWFAFIGCFSHHFIVFLFLFFAVAFLVYFFKTLKESAEADPTGQAFKEKKETFRIFKYTLLIFLIFFIFSIWWVLPYFNLSSSQGQFIQETVSQEDLKAFQTESDAKYGVLWNVAAMYGFWGDRMEQYIVPKDVIPYWFFLFLIILSLVIWGAVSKLKVKSYKVGKLKVDENQKEGKCKVIIFIIIGIISFILSVGIAYPLFAPLINFLNEKIFIFKGFRDSQKFTALLVLTYAYLGALGVNNIVKSSKFKVQSSKAVLSAFFITLPILYSPLMVWGFKGQLFASHYPQNWFEVNEILNQDEDNFKVLFFPWHQYMSFSFAKNKVINNPAPRFFDKETITGDNMELGEIYTHSQRPISQFIEKEILFKRDEIYSLGKKLRVYNIKYIILAEEVDWLEYKFLDKQDDLEIIYDSDNLKIYQNKNFSYPQF